MQSRSWLIIPGDSDTKLSKAASLGADIIVVDLEGTVAIGPAKARARDLGASWLAAHRYQLADQARLGRWVRINSLDSRMWRDDLVAMMPMRPDGIILPCTASTEDLRLLAAEIYELEQVNQIAPGSTRLLPVVGETPASALNVRSLSEDPNPRLAGFTWSAEGLRKALGASRHRDARGGFTDTMRLVRAQVLLASHACGLIAVETMHRNFSDEKGLKAAVKEARADGFCGMMAVHPAQVPLINAAFTPSTDELEQARQIVALFEGNSDSSAPPVDRRLINRSSLKQARRLLGLDDGPVELAPTGPVLRPA